MASEPPKSQVNPELAEKLILGEITPGQYLGMSPENLYKIAAMGHEMFKSGQTQGALDVFEGLVAASPYDSVFHCHLAATYARLDRFDEAMASYTRSLELNIANVDALVGRSELYMRERKISEALQDIQQALKLDPQASRDTTKRARATLQLLQNMAETPDAPKK
ncbi:tetratricopeptide repeat protein [Hyalangium sp.]|uniref:tetratricopeptide repeat protein n=1 Tax=Hyalangium sp. TaxID=2028555 RepID=UPI00389A5EC1